MSLRCVNKYELLRKWTIEERQVLMEKENEENNKPRRLSDMGGTEGTSKGH